MTYLTKNIIEDSEIRFYKVAENEYTSTIVWFASLVSPNTFREAVANLKADMQKNASLGIEDLEDYCDCYLFPISWTYYV